jgi:hypothetical protein
MRARYALKTLMIARARFLIAVFGISMAAFLMMMQGSLLYGYMLSTSALIDAIDADIWIVARGTAALDFAAPFHERFAWIAPGVPGVAKTGRGLRLCRLRNRVVTPSQ